jgi:hypothetical protein
MCPSADAQRSVTRLSGTSSTTAWLKLLFRFANQIVILRALGFSEPRGSTNWRSCQLHRAYFHVANNIGQHFDQAKQNDKRHHAENHYCHHGAPRVPLLASISKTRPGEHAHTDESRFRTDNYRSPIGPRRPQRPAETKKKTRHIPLDSVQSRRSASGRKLFAGNRITRQGKSEFQRGSACPVRPNTPRRLIHPQPP